MSRKTYRVAGKHAVLGHAPGKKFECELDPKTETRLLQSGALQVVTKAAVKTKRASEPALDNKDKE